MLLLSRELHIPYSLTAAAAASRPRSMRHPETCPPLVEHTPKGRESKGAGGYASARKVSQIRRSRPR